MFDFSIFFYFISIGIVCLHPFCKGATHWFVTEDGRIQQQDDSVFNLKRPYDLVTFIQQQTAFDRLKILREEYLEEKRKVIEAREKERAEIQKSFYEEDPDCVDAGGHISEFELHLDMTLPFSKKGINLPDHLNLCQSLPSDVQPPVCQAQLPTVIYSYDHLEGVKHRHLLNSTAEPMLLTTMSSYFKTAEELGGQVSLALEKNSTSWVLLNLAAYYWRIKGNALHAVECLRQALYYSPREHKDRALMSLAAVLYHANHTHDSVVLLHTAMETCQEYSVYHFLLGNIYASQKMYEMADLCYKFTVAVSPDTKSLCERVKAVRCEVKLKQLLKERQLAFDERLDFHGTPELDDSKEFKNEEAEKKELLPLETFKKQLNRLYLLTEGLPKNPDSCKSRSVPVKQEGNLPSDGTGTTERREKQPKNEDSKETVNKQRNEKEEKETGSTGLRTLPQGEEESKHNSDAIESDLKSKSLDRNGQDEERTIWKEKRVMSESLKARNSRLNNSKFSIEMKTMQDLEEARLALTRLKHVMKTVTHTNSATQTVKITEEKVLQGENGAKTNVEKTSCVESISTLQEKEMTVKKGNTGRRGESGFKTMKRGAGFNNPSEDGFAGSVIADDGKFVKQKGESIVLSKNDPGSKFDYLIPSKNTRDNVIAESLFEQLKGSVPSGPKHTPPLKDKAFLSSVRNCEDLGRKKLKGEAVSAECLTQDSKKQTHGTSAGRDVGVESFVSTTEFTKAEENELSTDKRTLLDSDGEVILMKQTLADEISANVPTDSLLSKRTSEAKVLEQSEKKSNRNTKVNIGSTASDNNNLKVNSVESVSATQIKGSDLEIESKKHHWKTNPGEYEKPNSNVPENNDDARSKTRDEEDYNNKDSGRPDTNGVVKNPKNANGEKSKAEERQNRLDSSATKELPAKSDKSSKLNEVKFKPSPNIKEKVNNAEFLHSVGAGSSVFETSFMNVQTDGSLQDLSEEECRHIEGVQALIVRNKQFSAWLSLDTKNIDVRAHIDFLSEVDDFPRRPRCTAKIRNKLHTFHNLPGVVNAAYFDQVAEVGLTQTLLSMGRTLQDTIDEMGTRIYNALKKNSSSWVLLNVASLYWRVQGDTAEAIKCLRQALSFSPSNARDVAHVSLASILLREGQLEDAAVVIKKALEISPSLALGHFILGNVFGAQSEIPEAIQHYLLALQLEPGFTPAVERLKIIQCVLWKQQKALEKEAADLRKLLTPK